MKYPSMLKENSCIGVVAPSAGADSPERKNRMKNAKKNLEKLGYNVILSKNIFQCERGRSAPKKIRAKEINDMMKNKEIDMLLCAAGGDFLIEILPLIDFEKIKENPKLIAGFSDPTGFLYPITTKCDIATIYGQNFSSFGAEKLHESQKDFIEIITGKKKEEESYKLYEEERKETKTGLEGYNLTEKVYWKTLDGKKKHIEGRIIGGCFDIIAELIGTRYDGIKEFQEKYKEDGIIWYFDNCELSYEEVIRTLWKMNEFDYFKDTKGIIFGRFGIEKTNYDYDMKTCIQDSILNNLQIPIIYNADISHKSPCLTIINGAPVTMDVEKGKAKLSWELK